MNRKIVIMLVEDSQAYRKVILRALGTDPGIQEILQFGTAEIALRSLTQPPRIQPDLILLDLSLPGTSGLDAIPRFMQAMTEPRIIMLTQSDQPADVVETISRGAVGYLLKSATSQQIKDAIWTTMNGVAPLDPAVSKHITDALKERGPKIEIGRELSERETAVLTLMAEGLPRKQIAIRLQISTSTVVTHINRIYEKLEVPNAPAAISKAHRSGLL